MKYAWIKEFQQSFDITVMCKVLKVNRSAYYHWVNNGCIINKVDVRLNQLIKDIFYQYREVYGTRRIKEALVQEYGVIVSTRKIAKCMKEVGISVKMKRKFKVVTTDSNHNHSISPNRLQRDFRTNIPDEVYVGDITYIRTQQGWLYLAVVIDLFSRKIVGWSMDDSMQVSLVNNALQMALQTRQPLPNLIWHTDRGSQYASDAHRELLAEHDILQSMSRKGDCWDNAVSESFFHSLKTELVHHERFKTRAEANQAIFEYIEVFYNRQRLHSTNGYMSPVNYELKMLEYQTAA
jgi:transposase InsO family protein